VRCKADWCQFNLPHGTKTEKYGKELKIGAKKWSKNFEEKPHRMQAVPLLRID